MDHRSPSLTTSALSRVESLALSTLELERAQYTHDLCQMLAVKQKESITKLEKRTSLFCTPELMYHHKLLHTGPLLKPSAHPCLSWWHTASRWAGSPPVRRPGGETLRPRSTHGQREIGSWCRKHRLSRLEDGRHYLRHSPT